MWCNWPANHGKMEIAAPAYKLTATPVEQPDLPDDALGFLSDMGWVNQWATTNHQLFTHPTFPGYYEWYEAVAMEQIRFMRIGAGK